VKSGKEKQKIIGLGDSHVRGMANELKHRLNDKLENLSIAKPRSMLVNVVNSSYSNLKTLKRNDICVIWGVNQRLKRNNICVIWGVNQRKTE
jgi:hypothetical protein